MLRYACAAIIAVALLNAAEGSAATVARGSAFHYIHPEKNDTSQASMPEVTENLKYDIAKSPPDQMVDSDEKAIAAILARFQAALNAPNMEGALSLYAPDAVAMAPNNPSNVGIDAIRKAYTAGFGVMTLNVVFNILEIHVMSPTWAFARCTSAGTMKIHATGTSLPEANQELFVFQKVDGAWKIARYSFSTTLPA
jgi:uncharacterized protein (TIGR02246 family)